MGTDNRAKGARGGNIEHAAALHRTNKVEEASLLSGLFFPVLLSSPFQGASS